MFISAGFAVQNGIALVLIAIAMISAYIYRIRVEETMLQVTFGDRFMNYSAHTWRLIPFLY